MRFSIAAAGLLFSLGAASLGISPRNVVKSNQLVCANSFSATNLF